MSRLAGRPARYVLAFLFLCSAVLTRFVPVGADDTAHAQGAVLGDDPAQKAADLRRAALFGASPDRLVVVYRDGTAIDDAVRRRVRQASGGALLDTDGALRRDVLRLPGADAAVVAARVRSFPGVLAAYPDPVAYTTLSVNDPRHGDEWGLQKIHAPEAWDSSRGSGVPVAVLDCGIHAAHPDLAGRVTLEQNFSSAPSTDDLCNHGTHVAGTIAALTDNGLGIAAVAPGATLMNGKVLSDSGSGYFSDIDRAIRWAADSGAKVINMSLGAAIACPAGTQTAVDYATGKGVVIIAAAGNDGLTRANAPANCAGVIGVAATDVNDRIAGFSNRTLDVDVAAPGVSILSTVNSALPENGGAEYRWFSGTSMAAPHAAGVAALIFSSSHGSTAATVRDRLFSSADAIPGTGSLWIYGRINAARAVDSGSTAVPPATPSPSATATRTATPLATATLTATATRTVTTTPVASATPTATHPPAPTATATATATGTAAPAAPQAPANLVAAARSGYIRLTWRASSTAGVTYDVYRGSLRGGSKQLIAFGVTGTRYDDAAVISGQRYFYSVRARNAVGESAASNEDAARAR